MDHAIVSREEWLRARQALLAREKALTRERDALAAARRALPWVRVETDYVFAGPEGPVRLAELFRGRSQLIVDHFMMGPGWKQGCLGCSFGADHLEGALMHLGQRDVAFAAVSRATLPEITAFRQRMGWTFDWVSSHGNSFNYDFGVSFTPEQVALGRIFYNYAWREIRAEELPGFSVFARDAAGGVFHTYSCFARGTEPLAVAYWLLDLLPKGREEGPEGMAGWVRHHDRYGSAAE